MRSHLILYCHIISGLSKEIIMQFTMTFYSMLLIQGSYTKFWDVLHGPYLMDYPTLMKGKEIHTLMTFSSC